MWSPAGRARAARRGCCPRPGSGRPAQFVFDAAEPARYLSCLISRFQSGPPVRLALSRVPTKTPVTAARSPPIARQFTSRPELCGEDRRHPDVLCVPDAATRRTDSFTVALTGRRPAGRTQPGVFRDAQPAAAEQSVRVEQRSGGLSELSVVLPGARDRASVVGPGRRVEELPRAVAERGLRAVLRGAVRRARARPRHVRGRAAADGAAGRS